MNGAGKKVVVVTNSSSYEPRAEWVGELFKQQGAQVLWVETDFIHREKVKKVRSAPDHMYIDTVPYRKNMILPEKRKKSWKKNRQIWSI